MTQQKYLIRFGESKRIKAISEFVVPDHFSAGKNVGGVKIGWTGPRLQVLTSTLVERDVPDGELVTDRLALNMSDDAIETNKGVALSSLAIGFYDLHEYLKSANKKDWHFGYVVINEVLWAVHSLWRGVVDDRSWDVGLYPVPRPSEWFGGDVLVSRKPLAT